MGGYLEKNWPSGRKVYVHASVHGPSQIELLPRIRLDFFLNNEAKDVGDRRYHRHTYAIRCGWLTSWCGVSFSTRWA